MVAKLREHFRRARTLAESFTPSAVQVAGLALFSVGAFLLAAWLGFMVAGVLTCVVGWAIDK